MLRLVGAGGRSAMPNPFTKKNQINKKKQKKHKVKKGLWQGQKKACGKVSERQGQGKACGKVSG